ncbi:hypothetical protein KAJ87_02635 [Candidatus Pacearchaeota archaeon]|nr:hypothetical protein [Candidatus Pacearchaeota archaeon]
MKINVEREIEDIFVMVFSWGIPYAEDIFRDLDVIGKRNCLSKIENVPLELISKQYEKHSSKPFYHPMVLDHSNRPAIIATYSGNLESFLRTKKEIRKRYDSIVPEHPDFIRDVIHSSDGKEEYNLHTSIWREYLI